MPERILTPRSTPPTIFGGGVVATPFQFLTDGDDNLRVRVWSTASGETLSVALRVLTSDSKIQVTERQITLGGLGTLQTSLIKLAPGAVLSVSTEVLTGLVARGRVFVQIDLVRGFDGPLVTLGTLIQGYVGTFMGLAFPGSVLSHPLDGAGWQHHVVLSAPPAGSEFSGTIGAAGRFMIHDFHGALATNATAGTRLPTLFVRDAGFNYHTFSPVGIGQAPSTSVFYHWQPRMTMTPVAGGVNVAAPWPATRFPAGLILGTGTLNLAAGDQWSTLGAYIEEWIDPWA